MYHLVLEFLRHQIKGKLFEILIDDGMTKFNVITVHQKVNNCRPFVEMCIKNNIKV